MTVHVLEYFQSHAPSMDCMCHQKSLVSKKQLHLLIAGVLFVEKLQNLLKKLLFFCTFFYLLFVKQIRLR